MTTPIQKLAMTVSVFAIVQSACLSGASAREEAIAEIPVDEIITIGTRRKARSAADHPAPIDVIDGSELLHQGGTDIANLLRTAVPSYNVNTQAISDAATLVRPANLRGLSPDSTLVLVNGKRRHRAAVISFLGGGISDGAHGPDIAVIPAIALKNVEVLRDGAASQYGSDAIAGVINFNLRDEAEGLIVEGQWGETYKGDGGHYKVSANLGLPITIGNGGFLNISGEYSETDATSRSVQRDDAADLIATGNTAIADPAQIWGQPNVNDNYAFFANTAVSFSDAVELYAHGNYAERQVEGGFFFRNPTNRGGVFSNDGGATLLVGDLTTDGSGNCPTIAITDNIPDPAALAAVIADPNCFAFNELFPGGFTPRFGGNLEDRSIVVGSRGMLSVGSGLSYDISYSYGKNKSDFFINNTINASLGPDTPTSFAPGGYRQTDNNFNIDLAYGVPVDFFASDLNVAAGFELRKETFTIEAGETASFLIGPLAAPSTAFPAGQGFSSSSNGFGGFTTASAGASSQRNYALYLDLEADVTDRLILQGALRYEDFYNTFGGTTNFKVGGLYKLSDFVRLRSTYSTGFHAPTAGQANVSNITTAFSGAILVDQGTIPLTSNAGQFIADFIEDNAGIRPELGPETSRSFTIGLGFNLMDIDVTFDYFHITVKDRISISDQQDFVAALRQTATNNNVSFSDTDATSQLLNLLDGAGVLNAADFAGAEDLTSFGFFNNAFDTRTQGLDLVASTALNLTEDGETRISLALNWTDTKVTSGTLSDGSGPLSFTRERQIEDSLPAWRGNIAITHNQGPWRGLARLNYFGSFFECHLDSVGSDAIGSCDLPINASSEITADMEIGYQITENFELVAGASNMFDSTPDANPFAGTAGAQFPVVAPNGFNGGAYYIRVRAGF